MIHKNENGFMLMEVLLYIAIFSIIVGGIIGLATLSTASRAQNQTRADLNYQGQAVLALIVQSIHSAKSISAPAIGNNSDTLTLDMVDSSISPTQFESDNLSSYNAIKIKEGTPEIANYITNSRVTVSNLKFTNMSVGSASKSVLIQFDLSYNNLLKREEFDYKQSFSGAATLP